MSTADDASEHTGWNPWFGPLALAVGFVFAAIGGVVIVEIVLGHATRAALNNPPPSVIDSSTVVQDIGFVAVALWIASWVARPQPAQFGLRRPRDTRKAVLIVPAAFVGFLIVAGIWAVLLNSSTTEKTLVKDVGAHAGALGVIAAILVTCVVAPVCEEFLFRGFIFAALRNWRGPALAAVLTGVLFGAIHIGSAPAVDLVPLGLLGVMLCAIRQWTGSLYPCIALHALNNSIALGENAGWGAVAVTLVLAASLAAIGLLIALTLRLTHRPLAPGSP